MDMLKETSLMYLDDFNLVLHEIQLNEVFMIQ